VREEREKGVFLRIEAFEAFHADGVALGLHLRAAISAVDMNGTSAERTGDMIP
jgi:hypothetical protein